MTEHDYPQLGRDAAGGDASALQLIFEGANSGDRDAQLEAGFLHAKGEVVEQDDEIAAAWYLKSAAQGVLNAQFNLGCMNYLGHGFDRSIEHAITWFELAAKGGHAQAARNIALMSIEKKLADQEHALYVLMGVDKIKGLEDLKLAKRYLTHLKKLTADSDVRSGLRLHKMDVPIPEFVQARVDKALMLIRNLSSATPIAVNLILECAIYDVWDAMDQKLSEVD